MSSGLCPRLCQVFLLCAFLSFGCQQSQSPPQSEKIGREKMPTPEEARRALLGMLEGDLSESLPWPDTIEELKSKTSIEELKGAPIERAVDGSFYVIGRWTCESDKSIFQTNLPFPGHTLVVHGRFQKTQDGGWKATIVSFTLARPEQK